MSRNMYWLRLNRWINPKPNIKEEIDKDVRDTISYLIDNYPLKKVPIILRLMVEEFTDRAIKSSHLKKKELEESISLIKSIDLNLTNFKKLEDEKIT